MMSQNTLSKACVLLIPMLLVAGADPAWQGKRIADWSEDDAHEVLGDSPWAKSVTPKVTKAPSNEMGRRGSGMQMGGMGIGMPGMGGMGRRGGMHQTSTDTTEGNSTASGTPPKLTVRWESALPVQAAELKARNVNAPSMDEDHYAIAVYGIPNRMVNADAQGLNEQLKDQAALKREGKKDLKPSSAEFLPRDDGNVVVYFFPRSKEITKQDKEVDFEAQIGRLQFSVPFAVEAMVFQGKMEL